MNDWKINAKIIRKWMRLITKLYSLVILEKKELIEKDYEINKLKEVIEEYDDIIFKERK